MKRGQLLIALLAVAAVAAVAALAGGGSGSGGAKQSAKAPAGAPAAAGAIHVSFAYSPEKEGLLAPLIAAFNRERREVGGKPVFVDGSVVASGTAEDKIAKGRLKPVAWSPASSLWGRLLNFQADRPLAPAESPSIVRTPLVIAMWEPMARALGWPRKKLGFADILRLASSNQGWAKVGHPEFGSFKLVHTNPDYSTSGLSAVVAEYYAATGKKEGLTEKDIRGSAARKTVRGIERSIVHYGDTTLFIADQMHKEGPAYASAVAMEEATLLDFNRTRGSRDKLVAIYPQEGTYYSDSPFILLSGEWVSPAQAAGAKAFQRYLAQQLTPERAAKSGFRPAGFNAKPAAPIVAANGVDPAQPTRVLGLPEPRVLDAARRAWRNDRKPANILLVLDTSGSMNGNRLTRAKQGLRAFFAQVGKQDSVGLTIFSDKIQPLVPISPFGSVRSELGARVGGLIADGGTAVYDATVQGFDQVRGLGDRDHINAVVLLTDGEDTDSGRTAQDVVEHLRSQGDSPNRVRVFTIAYSEGATNSRQALDQIAAASGGQGYTGQTDDIEAVYRSIASFF